ncbi:hypothetical protein Tco_0660480 [Tanacetum coccineum]
MKKFNTVRVNGVNTARQTALVLLRELGVSTDVRPQNRLCLETEYGTKTSLLTIKDIDGGLLFALGDSDSVEGKQNKASCKADYYESIQSTLTDVTLFSWVFFLASKDETSGILKRFITEIENQLNHKGQGPQEANGDTDLKKSVDARQSEGQRMCLLNNILCSHYGLLSLQATRAQMKHIKMIQLMMLLVKLLRNHTKIAHAIDDERWGEANARRIASVGGSRHRKDVKGYSSQKQSLAGRKRINKKRHWIVEVLYIEEVYVSQPLGFVDPEIPKKVYKVEKAFTKLLELGMNSYYLLEMDSTGGLYCHDFVLKEESRMNFNGTKFQMSSMGELTFFLGLQVKQKKERGLRSSIRQDRCQFGQDIHIRRLSIFRGSRDIDICGDSPRQPRYHGGAPTQSRVLNLEKEKDVQAVDISD